MVVLAYLLSYFRESSRGGLEVELWTDNSLPSTSVDQKFVDIGGGNTLEK